MNEPVSYHSFLFPFKWEILSDSLTTFAEKIDLQKLQHRLKLLPGNTAIPKSWIRKQFVLDSHIGYNEYNYFYDFVRDVIYDVGDIEEESKFSPNNKSLVHHYEFLLPAGNNFFEIECNKGKNDILKEAKTPYGDLDIGKYSLHIKKIFLNVYDSGVAVLSYHLLNYNYQEPDDILNINQFGRRAFIGGFQLGNYPSRVIKSSGSGRENKVDLAFSISLKFADGSELSEKFDWGDPPFKHYTDLPLFITGLFAQNVITTDWGIKYSRDSLVWIAPCIDDRMFVVSWYQGEARGILFKEGKANINFTQSDFWYKYIYIDKHYGQSHMNTELQKKLETKSTYDRWRGYNTLYGVSRYSFVMFCDGAPDFLKAVFETMYLKMAEIALVQRASVLRFSDEVQYISGWDNEAGIAEQTIGLYKYYLRFINKIDFREVTAQEQGIELYDMLRESMRIEGHVTALDHEIKTLHEHALLLQERKRREEEEKRNNSLNLITRIGLPLTIVSFIITFWGLINDINVWYKGPEDENGTFALNISDKTWFLAALFIVLAVLMIFNLHRSQRKILKIGGYILVLVLSLLAIVLPFIKI